MPTHPKLDMNNTEQHKPCEAAPLTCKSSLDKRCAMCTHLVHIWHPGSHLGDSNCVHTPPAGWMLHSSQQSIILFPTASSGLPSECADGEREVAPWWRDDVALLSGQPQQQVLDFQGPAVDPGALEPGGYMTLLAQAHKIFTLKTNKQKKPTLINMGH